jgi:hypothetical protein
MSDPITIVTQVPAAVAITVAAVGPQGATGVGTRKFAAVFEWGDAYYAGVLVPGQASRVRANGAGSFSRFMVDADVACDAQFDILKNGVSIFGVGSTKPNLTADVAYDSSVMTDITTAVAEGDLIMGVLESYTGSAKQITLTCFISPA